MPEITNRPEANMRGRAARDPDTDRSELELLAGLRDGSEAHFTELYDHYFKRIYTFAFARVHNHADAEEIAQETFIAVLRSVDSFGGRSSLLSWIYGIAKNTANNHLRRQKTQQERLDTLDPELGGVVSPMSIADPGECFDMQVYADSLEAKLGTLADWQVEIFCMRHLENLSIPEICDRTDRSSDAVRSRLYRVKRVFFETAEGVRAQ